MIPVLTIILSWQESAVIMERKQIKKKVRWNGCIQYLFLFLRWHFRVMSHNFVFYVQDRVRTIGQEAARLCEIHPEHAAQIQVNSVSLCSSYCTVLPFLVRFSKLVTLVISVAGWSEMCTPVKSGNFVTEHNLEIFGRALLGCFGLYQIFVKTHCQWNNFPIQSSLMRKQFIVGSFKDPGFGNFVTKLWFEKSKWNHNSGQHKTWNLHLNSSWQIITSKKNYFSPLSGTWRGVMKLPDLKWVLVTKLPALLRNYRT